MPTGLIAVTLEAMEDGCYGLSGDGGTLSGCSPDDPVVSASLPPGEYVLSPLPDALNSWGCAGGTLDVNTGRLTLSSSDSAVRCVWDVVGEPLPTSTTTPAMTTTTTPAATTTIVVEAPSFPPATCLTEPRGESVDCGELPQTGDGGPRPDQLYIDADLSADEYAEEIAERTFVATATVTIDGQDLDDLESLVEG